MENTRVIVNDPDGTIYGFPTYRWGEADPTVFATRRQLAALGLRKNRQDPAAQMLRPRARRPDEPLRAWLYRIDQAAPRRPFTPGKLAAVWTAAHSRKRCDLCERSWPELTYVPRAGVCEDCRTGAAPMEAAA